LSYIIDAGEKPYVFESFDLMKEDYIKKYIKFAVCEGCKKIYLPEDAPSPVCCEGEPYTSYRVADIVGANYNWAIERKRGQNLVTSLNGNELYGQLEKLKAFFGSNWALVLEGTLEELFLDPDNKSRRGQILSIPATVMQYGGSFIQVNHITTLIRMLKYFDQKCGKEPKIRLTYHAIDENLPKFQRLLIGGIKGINIGKATDINSVYSNALDLSLDLSTNNLKKIPRIGKVWREKLKEWFL
jgi:ERCC4-type nuclease